MFTVFIVGHVKYDDAQAWMWTRDNRAWYVNLTAVLVGVVQYYWVFMAGLMALLFIITVALLIYCCCTGQNLGIFQENEQAGRQPLLPHEQEQMTEKLKLMSSVFDQSKHREQSECCICMVEYQPSDMVTPLPCDKRHFFHSECIERWSLTQNDCPLCKEPFDADILAESLKNRSSITDGVADPEAGFFQNV